MTASQVLYFQLYSVDVVTAYIREESLRRSCTCPELAAAWMLRASEVSGVRLREFAP